MTRPTRDDVAAILRCPDQSHSLEVCPAKYVDMVMPMLDDAHDRLAQAWNEGFDRGYEVGYNDASDPDAPSFQRNNPYPLARDAALAGDDS